MSQSAAETHSTSQGLLTWHLQVALPCHTLAQQAQQQFEAAGLGPGSYDDAVLSAHAALGLVTEVGPLNDRHAMPALHAPADVQLQPSADLTVLKIVCSVSDSICCWIPCVLQVLHDAAFHGVWAPTCLTGGLSRRAYCFPSITPLKDMETVVQGTSLTSPSFQAAIHAALRTLIDQLGVTTFNVGISGIGVPGSALPSSSKKSAALAPAAGKITARQVQLKCLCITVRCILESTAGVVHSIYGSVNYRGYLVLS